MNVTWRPNCVRTLPRRCQSIAYFIVQIIHFTISEYAANKSSVHRYGSSPYQRSGCVLFAFFYSTVEVSQTLRSWKALFFLLVSVEVSTMHGNTLSRVGNFPISEWRLIESYFLATISSRKQVVADDPSTPLFFPLRLHNYTISWLSWWGGRPRARTKRHFIPRWVLIHLWLCQSANKLQLIKESEKERKSKSSSISYSNCHINGFIVLNISIGLAALDGENQRAKRNNWKMRVG